MAFIVIGNEKRGFQDFFQSCQIVGSYIAGITRPRDVVLISKRTSFAQIEAFIGCILYNRIPIIIPHPSTKVFHNEFVDKMNKIDEVVGPALCMSDVEDQGLYSKIWKTVSSINQCEILPTEEADQKSTAFIQLSSGTTGRPKVVEITHSACIEQCDEYANALKLQGDDVIVSWLPLYHDMGLIACFLLPLLHNISFVHIHPFEWLSNPELLFKYIHQYKGTHTWMPNFAFSYMAKRCKKSTYNLSSMKRWVSCSEVTHHSDLMSFMKSFGRNGITKRTLQVCYALAENVFAVSQSGAITTVNYDGREVVSCGPVLTGTSVIIMDGNKVITSTGKAGSVLIKSSYMANGIRRGKFGYYDTGDIGFIKKGHLYILGRSDDMINSYGKNIFPYSIEKICSETTGVVPGRVACFGVYSEKEGTEKVYLVVESEAPSQSLIKEISSKVSRLFDVSPRCFVRKKGYLIKTSSGKISRKKTREKVLEEMKHGRK